MESVCLDCKYFMFLKIFFQRLRERNVKEEEEVKKKHK